MKKHFGILSMCMLLALSAASSRASTITLLTPAGADIGERSVSAAAVFTMGDGSITLDLKNLIANPAEVAQNLSAFTFTLDGAIGTASLASSSGVERTIYDSGAYKQGRTVAAGWALKATGATVSIDVLSGAGHAGPEHTIIGAPGSNNRYTQANGSLKTGSHNPFMDETATFTFNIAGVTANTRVTSGMFQFGTTDGMNRISVDVATENHSTAIIVPLPAAVWPGAMLLGAMCVSGALRRRRNR